MGWILIVVGIVLLAIALWAWLFRTPSGTPGLTQGQKALGYQDKAVPGQGMAKNILTRAQVRSDIKTQQVVNVASYTATQGIEEQSRAIDAVLRQEGIIDVHRRGSEAAEAQHITQLTELESRRVELKIRNELMRLAQDHEMDITTYLQVTGHRNLKQIDLVARAVEYQQDQENVSRIQQEKLELIDRASHRLYSFYEKRKELEASDDPAKDDKLRHLNQLIDGAERLILGEQNRYIQATLGEEAPRGLQADDSGTGDTGETETDEV